MTVWTSGTRWRRAVTKTTVKEARTRQLLDGDDGWVEVSTRGKRARHIVELNGCGTYWLVICDGDSQSGNEVNTEKVS